MEGALVGSMLSRLSIIVCCTNPVSSDHEDSNCHNYHVLLKAPHPGTLQHHKTYIHPRGSLRNCTLGNRGSRKLLFEWFWQCLLLNSMDNNEKLQGPTSDIECLKKLLGCRGLYDTLHGVLSGLFLYAATFPPFPISRTSIGHHIRSCTFTRSIHMWLLIHSLRRGCSTCRGWRSRSPNLIWRCERICSRWRLTKFSQLLRTLSSSDLVFVALILKQCNLGHE